MADSQPLGDPKFAMDVEEMKKNLRKHGSDNVSLDKEFKKYFPNIETNVLQAMSREERIAKLAITKCQRPDPISVDPKPAISHSDFSALLSHMQEQSNLASAQYAADRLAADERFNHLMLMFMQKADADKDAALATQRATDIQIKMLAEQLEKSSNAATHNKTNFDTRLRNAQTIFKNVLSQMPSASKDLIKYFDEVERFFELNKTDDDLKVPLLNQLLSVKAKQLINRLPLEETTDYDSLKAALIREFHLTPLAFRELFDKIEKHTDESFTQFATRIEVNFKYYLKSRKVEDDFERLRLLMISDKLRQHIPSHLLDFATQQELHDWLTPQKLAHQLDAFNADRKPEQNTFYSKDKYSPVNNNAKSGGHSQQ